MDTRERTYMFGGWSQSPQRAPLPSFTTMMYGMVTNLAGLTTGTEERPGWSPARTKAPRHDDYTGPVLWTYGGGLCAPDSRPASSGEIEAIVAATTAGGWDGVDFDDECHMDIGRVIEAMALLKGQGKQTSYTFIGGYSYNSPQSSAGAVLNDKVRRVIASGYCDRLVHMCYGSSMWSSADIERHVRQALERSLAHGARPASIVLALTSRGLIDANLAYFLDQVTTLGIGGLFVWAYERLEEHHLEMILRTLDIGGRPRDGSFAG
jgi:hypothetical protein